MQSPAVDAHAADAVHLADHSRCPLGIADFYLEISAPLYEISYQTFGDELSTPQDCHAVADLLDLVEQVTGQQDAPALFGEMGDKSSDLLLAGRIEAVCRFIEDYQFRVTKQGGGNAKPLLHSKGVGMVLPVSCLAEPDHGEKLLDSLLGNSASRERKGTEIVPPGQVRIEGW